MELEMNQTKEEAKASHAQSHPNLLIVDDNPAVVKALAVRMSEQGYNCITALDGHQAMQYMTELCIDSIVTDLDMPYLDGFALVDLATSFKPCKCVIITGSAENAMQCYRSYPTVPVLMKPFQVEHIVTALSETKAIGPDAMPDAA